jgi:uncharacterized protein (TIGR02678 family)
MRVSSHDAELVATAIRALLAQPLLLRSRDEELFRTVATLRGFLAAWFEDNLGWQLQVDLRAGIARLHKRTQRPDARRGLRRVRASKRPFDAFRYQLLALTCAEILRRPHTTLGDLADAVARLCGADEALRSLDLTNHADRLAFVDALLWLIDVGALDVTAGEVDGFGGSADVDAVLVADTTLIPLLLSSDTAPSRIEATAEEEWLEALTRESRYGTAATDPENTDRDQRARWFRHQLIRQLLNDPVLDLGTLHAGALQYLLTPAGRDKVLSAAETTGLTVERHADVWLAIDASRESTAETFTSFGRVSTAEQAAAVVLSVLVGVDPAGHRRLLTRSTGALRAALEGHLVRTPGWARAFRGGEGVEALLVEAIDLLEEFGLVRREGGEIVPRPAAGRFAVRVLLADANAPKAQEVRE